MTIHLPQDLENKVRDQVMSGHFASEDEVIAEAVHLFLREQQIQQPVNVSATPSHASLGSIGAMSDSADELDEIVADAMRKRGGSFSASGSRVQAAE